MAIQKFGRGHAEHRDGAGHLVDPGAAFDGRDNPQWNGNSHRNDHGQRQQLQRIRKALEEEFRRRLLVHEGVPEVAADDAGEKNEELNVVRPVESEVPLDELALFLGRILRNHQIRRISGCPSEGEHDQSDYEKQDNALQKPVEDVFLQIPDL